TDPDSPISPITREVHECSSGPLEAGALTTLEMEPEVFLDSIHSWRLKADSSGRCVAVFSVHEHADVAARTFVSLFPEEELPWQIEAYEEGDGERMIETSDYGAIAGIVAGTTRTYRLEIESEPDLDYTLTIDPVRYYPLEQSPPLSNTIEDAAIF